MQQLDFFNTLEQTCKRTGANIIQRDAHNKNKEYKKQKCKEWRIKNLEYSKQKHREWLKNNREHIKKYRQTPHAKELEKIRTKKWKENNKEYIKSKNKEWRENNPELVRKHRQKNKKRAKDRKIERYKTEPNFRLRVLLRSRIAECITRKKMSRIYPSMELLGTDIDTAREYMEKQFKEGMTWDNHGYDGWHIDHIIPCASFDLTDPEQQKKCFHYTNLQPLWWWENLSKGAKIL